ncbi:TPA: Rha family transcriptional regulator [Enterobacter roggenkampii]
MSTEVIATEFGRRHDNVMQNIRSLIASGHLGALDFKDSLYISKQNKEIACFELTERGGGRSIIYHVKSFQMQLNQIRTNRIMAGGGSNLQNLFPK